MNLGGMHIICFESLDMLICIYSYVACCGMYSDNVLIPNNLNVYVICAGRGSVFEKLFEIQRRICLIFWKYLWNAC